jgi:hypothetical protein
MNQLVKRDLFAPIVIKKRKPPNSKRKTTLIPGKSNWKEENGSWAVKMGIVKAEQN